MSLAIYTPVKREIVIKGQVLGEVQGLSLESIAVLIRKHLPDLDAIVDLFNNADSMSALKNEEWIALAVPMITQAPGLVANIIALAAGETDATPVQSWPMGAQIATLIVIFDLTFSEIGEIKKAWEMIATLLMQTKKKNGVRITKTTTKPA